MLRGFDDGLDTDALLHQKQDKKSVNLSSSKLKLLKRYWLKEKTNHRLGKIFADLCI